MRLSVIVSTYNSPNSLLKTLYSLAFQTYRDVEILVADDGSGPETAEAVKRAEYETGIRVRHLWHEDLGFRKNAILNRAVMASCHECLVFLDGDCIARADLIGTHAARTRPRQVLTCGSQINLPKSMHSAVDLSAISAGLPFNPEWLAQRGVSLSAERRLRLGCRSPLSEVLDSALPRSSGFVGCNSSAWKQDILAVDGFDETISYGVDDKDLAVRLNNHGIRSRRLKYSLSYLHLDHCRPYADPDTINRNKQLIRRRKRKHVTRINSGIPQTCPTA